MENYSKYENLLKEKGIRPSSQRMLVLEYLDEHSNHPTADKIYRDLTKKLPFISKATVYNNLNLFVENNLVNKLSTQHNEINYEIKREPHGHFICDNCKHIYDFEISNLDVNPKELQGFDINNQEVVLTGQCKTCSLE